jgi:predicted nucleic acid-binding protein
MRLLDTDVMVDILRAYSPAVAWLESLDDDAPALPGFVALELMDGCRNKMEMKRLLKRLLAFQIHWPTDSDCNRALAEFARSRLSHHLSIMDSLIGECAVGLNATLCTFNTKHFKSIPYLRTEQPYARQSRSAG